MLYVFQLVRIRRSRSTDKMTGPSCNCLTISTAFVNCLRYNKEMNHYPLRVQQLAYCPCNMSPMRTYEGACLHLTTPHLHAFSESQFLHLPSLPYSGSSQKDRIKVGQRKHL